jgi:hypothetical protein
MADGRGRPSAREAGRGGYKMHVSRQRQPHAAMAHHVTKAEMGNQMARSLPVMSWAALACHTAMHTSQLHSTPRTIHAPKCMLDFFCAR